MASPLHDGSAYAERIARLAYHRRRWLLAKRHAGLGTFLMDSNVNDRHSSAAGPFGMRLSTRKHYLGDKYNSQKLADQYKAATGSVTDRYGGWDQAAEHWKNHSWY
jgi:hypothetical protein